MPNLKGLSPREVLKLFHGKKNKVSFKGFGIVNNQIPEAGSTLKDNDEVILKLIE